MNNPITKQFIIDNLINVKGGLKSRVVGKLNLNPEDLYLIYHSIKAPVNKMNQKYKFINFVKGYSSLIVPNMNNPITKQFIIDNLINVKGGLKSRVVGKLNLNPEDLYLIYHSIKAPVCINGNICAFKNFVKGFLGTCNNKLCNCSSTIRTEKRNKTISENDLYYYDIVLKTKATKLERYDDKNYNNSSKLAKTLRLNIKNYKDYNEHFTKENFIYNDVFDIYKMADYFGIQRYRASVKKKEFGIQARNMRTSSLIEENISKVFEIYFELRTREIIAPYELDLYSEKYKFAIEYNGLIWHSYGISKYTMFNNLEREDKKYHLMKTELCEEKGIQLFHIFENEWLDKRKKDIWISMIKGKQGLHTRLGARKCSIQEISSKEAKEFLEENHMQGSVNASARIALIYDNEIVSLMTFGKARMSKKYEYELLRFCTKKNLTVQGAGSRLLKYFEENYKPKSLVSYANRRWSQGNLYEKLDFTFIHNSGPNMFWFAKGSRRLESRQKYQKHKLKDIPDFLFYPDKTAKENMFLNGYRVIYDSGNKVYTKKYK